MRSALLVALSVAASAQSIRVYSEFAQINEKGEVTAPAQPREILSPAIVRNGFTSFQIVVQIGPGTQYWLYVGQNPENSVKISLYRESGGKLTPVAQPVGGSSTQVLWMDVWADRSAPVQRIKIEPQLSVGGDWVVYPMEARVMDAVLPDAASREPLCPAKAGQEFRLRNLLQDAALATRFAKPDVDRLKGQCGGAPGDPESYFKIRDYLFRMR